MSHAPMRHRLSSMGHWLLTWDIRHGTSAFMDGLDGTSVMDIAGLETWIAGHGYTRGTLADALGVNRKTVTRWLAGTTPLPDDLEDRLVMAPRARVADTAQDNGADIETAEVAETPSVPERSVDTERDIAVVADMVEPYDLPPGSPGWRYRPGSVLPKGQWTETLPEPVTYANGAVCRAIRWGSNGVGMPKMTLIGSTKDSAEPVHVRGSGYYPLGPGAFRSAEMGDRPEPPKLAAGEMAIGNIKEPYQKGGTKAQHGAVKPKPLMDLLDEDE